MRKAFYIPIVFLLVLKGLSAQEKEIFPFVLLNGQGVDTFYRTSENKKFSYLKQDTLSNDSIRVNSKKVFRICTNELLGFQMKFRYEDPNLADDIFINGEVLAYNNQYFLMQYIIGESNTIEVFHESKIAGKDLKRFRAMQSTD